jgi:N-acetylglucosamine transport system permease protein
MKKKAFRTPWLFILACTLPAFLLIIYFIIWPAIQVFYISFTDSSALALREPEMVGLANYAAMLQDAQFVNAFWNTAKLIIFAPLITVVFALILAFMVTQSKLKERAVYRTIFFFPSIVSIAVISIVWSFIFHPIRGSLNYFLMLIGIDKYYNEGFAWLSDPKSAIWGIAIAFIWQSVGYFMVMHIAAIDSISTEIFEAATIDGAGPIRKLLNITLPLIKEVVGITFIFALSGILDSSFSFSRVMTPSGQVGDVLLAYSYRMGFEQAQYGYAMAVTAFTLFIAVSLAAISRIYMNVQEREA